MGERTELVPKKIFSGKSMVWTFGVIFVIVFGVSLYLGLPLWGAVVGSLIIAAIISGWLSNFTFHQKVTKTVEVGRRKSCIACNQAVEHLNRGS
jgi:hypothetical protein